MPNQPHLQREADDKFLRHEMSLIQPSYRPKERRLLRWAIFFLGISLGAVLSFWIYLWSL